MDTKTLIKDAKARFSHNSAKAYLKEKYSSKLVIAEQGGLWRADAQTIGFLNSFSDETLVVIDTFDNPVKVNRIELLESLTKTYTKIMTEWNSEWKELERKR
ncbi:MAG: hypothetical protein CML44_00630 [Rhodobacteraceae bacterium]|jgi:hypothetical protein|nr:hypothetical protein [Paracoccaceae bacterium]|tara:strand:- start:6448 stop:6753 length:306 start_codon:yes stop_codon:yes gene_type:complete